MISQELLSEVLGIENILSFSINKWDYEIIPVAEIFIDMADGRSQIIPLDTLAHKCKEWAKKYKYIIVSYASDVSNSYKVDIDSFVNDYYDDQIKYFEAPTEPEVIFKATQWISETVDIGEQR